MVEIRIKIYQGTVAPLNILSTNFGCLGGKELKKSENLNYKKMFTILMFADLSIPVQILNKISNI